MADVCWMGRSRAPLIPPMGFHVSSLHFAVCFPFISHMMPFHCFPSSNLSLDSHHFFCSPRCIVSALFLKKNPLFLYENVTMHIIHELTGKKGRMPKIVRFLPKMEMFYSAVFCFGFFPNMIRFLS